MKHRLTILFALIVGVPLISLLFLGAKVVRDEQAVVRQRFLAFEEERLREIDRAVTRMMHEVEQEVEAAFEMPNVQPEALREVVRKAPLIVDVFWLSIEGELLHPRGEDLSEREREFLLRTKAIWSGRAMLYEPAKEESNPSWSKSLGRPGFGLSRDRVETHAARQERGWIAWYWEEGLHLLYFSHRPDGSVLGGEVSRIALLARVVGDLPDLGIDEGRIVLSDSKGEPLYQWGSFEPKKGKEPTVRLGLTYPLDTFTLGYFAPADAVLGRSLGLTVTGSLLALMLAVVGLAWYFHREQSRELREAEARVGFVTRVSHELKTPLTNIRLYAELLAEHLEGTEETGERYLKVIVNEGQRLSRLINNILTFAKQQKDRLELQPRAIEVDRVIAQVVEQFRPALESEGLDVELRLAAPRPITADPDALGQIVGNLVSNVEKYGKDGRWLGVETTQDEAWTQIQISDRGAGIPSSQREKIFQPFYRVSSKLNDGVTGTGIGLTIARDLARRHGGDLTLLDREGGTTFLVRLPTASGQEVKS